MTAFRAGVVAGLFLPLLAWQPLKSWIGLREPDFNVQVMGRGADLSGHGATRLAIQSARGDSVVQICRGTCDDLLVEERTGDNSYQVDALDGDGRCVACGSIGYVTGGYGADIERAVVEGAAQLVVRSSRLRRDPDGSLREIVYETPFIPKAPPNPPDARSGETNP